MNTERPTIGKEPQDVLASVASAVVSLTPVAGGILSQIAQSAIGDRQVRAERCLAYLVQLLVQHGALPASHTPSLNELQSVGLTSSHLQSMIDGAARALSDDAVSRIANLVFNGATDDAIDQQTISRLISIRSGLSDGAIVVLCRLHPEFSSDFKFYETHRAILDGLHIHEESDETELAQHNRYLTYLAELQSSGLAAPILGFDISHDAEAKYEITHIGAELLKLTDLVKANATIPLAMSRFTFEVLARYEALRDSKRALQCASVTEEALFLGFNPNLEAHYSDYCESIFNAGRYESHRPETWAVDITRSLGRMARIYTDVVERFDDFDTKRDYREDPLDAARIRRILSSQIDALAKIGIEGEE